MPQHTIKHTTNTYIHSNIFKQNIRKPQKAIICPFEECLCGPDIRIEKWAQG